MTKKHFQLIAQAIASVKFESIDDQVAVINSVTNALRTSNPRFDSERFKTACYRKD